MRVDEVRNDLIKFHLKNKKQNIEAFIRIFFENNNCKWNFHILNPRQRPIRLKNGILSNYGIGSYLNKEEKELIIELIRQIKIHPKYRLKILFALDDDIRPIWNNV